MIALLRMQLFEAPLNLILFTSIGTLIKVVRTIAFEADQSPICSELTLITVDESILAAGAFRNAWLLIIPCAACAADQRFSSTVALRELEVGIRD